MQCTLVTGSYLAFLGCVTCVSVFVCVFHCNSVFRSPDHTTMRFYCSLPVSQSLSNFNHSIFWYWFACNVDKKVSYKKKVIARMTIRQNRSIVSVLSFATCSLASKIVQYESLSSFYSTHFDFYAYEVQQQVDYISAA